MQSLRLFRNQQRFHLLLLFLLLLLLLLSKAVLREFPAQSGHRLHRRHIIQVPEEEERWQHISMEDEGQDQHISKVLAKSWLACYGVQVFSAQCYVLSAQRSVLSAQKPAGHQAHSEEVRKVAICQASTKHCPADVHCLQHDCPNSMCKQSNSREVCVCCFQTAAVIITKKQA